MRTFNAPALVVGFVAEARVARLSGWPVAIGGGTTVGAARMVRRLIEAGATGIVSFGLAGGLDPRLPAGALMVANAVTVNGDVLPTDPTLNARWGGSTGHLCLGLDRVIVSADEKRRLSQASGAAVVDMESGAVATIAGAAGVPFAVVRAVCDPAHRTLPPAALVALDAAGRLVGARLAMSILRRPAQLRALIALARDAALARRALRARAMRLAPGHLAGAGTETLADARPPKGLWPDGLFRGGLLREGLASIGRLPTAASHRTLRPEGTWSEGIWPEGTWPDGIWPDGIWPEGTWPKRMFPEEVLPDGMLTEGILHDGQRPDELLPEAIL